MYLLFGGKKIFFFKNPEDKHENSEYENENYNKITDNLLYFIKKLNPIDNLKIYKENVGTLESGRLLHYENISNILIFITLLYIFYSKSVLNVYIFILLYTLIFGIKIDDFDNFNNTTQLTLFIICMSLLLGSLLYLYLKKNNKKEEKKEEKIIKIESDRYF